MIFSLDRSTNTKCEVFDRKENYLNLIPQPDTLSGWCIENTETVNLEKTAARTFSFTQQALLSVLKCRDVALTHTSKFNYLGVAFNNKLNWKSHIESISSHFLKRVTISKRLSGSLWRCD
ncbi:hypothetical protein CEXT_307631 [Caerostris extrusa]|uniref:Uncharacterized protein n=1 Tax=Caerostris extrusa TaxID=172846 RepID=A0AAV4WE71_CAEEX|nr:hypothetical protein CEXT_307631 [Caerostris extrusa]